jgi:hypothetical protein
VAMGWPMPNIVTSDGGMLLLARDYGTCVQRYRIDGRRLYQLA